MVCKFSLENSNLYFTKMKDFWFVAIFMIFAGIKAVESDCSSGSHHCAHICQSTGKYNCLATQVDGHLDNHGCECLPKDYCDHRYSCSPDDVVCSHNEAVRCNGNNKCECFCSQDSQCHNCPAGTLGFCVNERCVCETNNFCPGGNKFYCLKNFHCAHNESKRCNRDDRCECFCDKDTDCKNCPEKGFCVDGGCVCETHDYCPKRNHMYCLYLGCDHGYTSKCDSTNRCNCAYVPDTCSIHDVSKCYHLTCSPGEKKYCEGRTCTCKPLDYCKQNDADCQHKTCDASKSEVRLCLSSGTCGCLPIPDLCGGDDTSTCQHLTCNQYQVKTCENGMCKCQVNPSCNANEGLNDTCTTENTYLELKKPDGTFYYANCTDSFHYPLCVEDRCKCVYWKTPPPPSTSEGSTTAVFSRTDISGSPGPASANIQTTLPVTGSGNPTTTAQSIATTTTTSSSVGITASTTRSTPCASRMDCNQQNTHVTFLTFDMPCPVDHIDCIYNKCFCSINKITTTPRSASTTTQRVATKTAALGSTGNSSHTTQTVATTTTTSIRSTPSTTRSTPLSTSHFSTTTNTGLMCPVCDSDLNCVRYRTCYPGQVCMIRSFNNTKTIHCSEKDDCNFMKMAVHRVEVSCCEDHQCIADIILKK